MLKKLIIWAVILLAAVQLSKTQQFQQIKNESFAKIWDMLEHKSKTKTSNQAQQFSKSIQFWLESFSPQEKQLIKDITSTEQSYLSFINNYCYEAKPYHPILSNAHLLLVCDKAKAIHQ
ncbi:hypothetical protein N7931_15675 [Catenovulum sp. 2E275]|uniref:hypothetical protein n=1 Tax=Catenovulum sp. 2E275 TaxID=2980497 RepID=UPI0021D0543A|nr:hypothetical protein [Catenovulum sp. 2E275]MCU4677073.1 hypothetical protein [Catenovulum sp. 2E275]